MDDCRHLLHRAGAAHGDALDHVVDLGRGELFENAGADDGRGDRVDADALGGDFLGQRSREDYSALVTTTLIGVDTPRWRLTLTWCSPSMRMGCSIAILWRSML